MKYLRFILLSLIVCRLAWAVGPTCPQAPDLFCATGNPGVFSVKAFGAVGDGTTDDTAAVRAAFAAVPAAGGTVYFPPGTYIIRPNANAVTMQVVNSNTQIVGVYGSSILKM